MHWTMLVGLVSLGGDLGSLRAQELPAQVEQRDSWESFEAEYRTAVQSWAVELGRGMREGEPGKSPDWPAIDYWPRAEALVNDGRAVVWMLRNLSSAPNTPTGQSQRVRDLFDRVRLADGAPWTAEAIPTLVALREELGGSGLPEMLESLAEGERPPLVLRAARLGLADILESEDATRATSLRLRAYAGGSAAMEPVASMSPERLNALAELILSDLKEENSAFNKAWLLESPAGLILNPAAPAKPEETARPALEALANAGSTRAGLWVLDRTWASDDAARARLRLVFERLLRSELDEQSQDFLAAQIAYIVPQLGPETVEPAVLAYVERIPGEKGRAFLTSLGKGLCESAKDSDQRDRGLAVLRRVIEAWPESAEATTARGKVFRYTQLVVGQHVPDFESLDVEGQTFRLSDYEGKVTVIDFWGFW